MIEFLKTYWKLIVALVLIALDVVLLVLKKRPLKVVDAITATISDILPSIINEAEAKYGIVYKGELPIQVLNHHDQHHT